MRDPTISAVIRVYNGEQHVGETVRAVLSQSRPADEVVVVDDGSTDATRDVLARFGRAVRVVAQQNEGHTAALNRCFDEARMDFIANCDADDLWYPDKLERQLEVVRSHPTVDISFTGARSFGLVERRWCEPPGDGILDGEPFRRAMFRRNLICASSTLIRRRLWARVGPFAEALCCEDYDYWLRALRVGARFHYDPRVLVGHREHDLAATRNALKIKLGTTLVHCGHADVAGDRRLARRVMADDLSELARLHVDRDEIDEARRLFAASVRRRPSGFAAAWWALTALPERSRGGFIAASIAVKRRLERARAVRFGVPAAAGRR